MMKFLKRTEVEAVRLDASRWSEVTAFIAGTDALGVQLHDGRLALIFPHRMLVVPEGDWLVREGHALSSCTDEIFRATYEPIKEGADR